MVNIPSPKDASKDYKKESTTARILGAGAQTLVGIK